MGFAIQGGSLEEKLLVVCRSATDLGLQQDSIITVYTVRLQVEELDEEQMRLGAFYHQLLRDHRLVPWDVDADGNCLLYALNQGRIWLAERRRLDWGRIGDYNSLRADVMDDIDGNPTVYAHLEDEHFDWGEYTARHRVDRTQLETASIMAFVRLTGISVLVYIEFGGVLRGVQRYMERGNLHCHLYF